MDISFTFLIKQNVTLFKLKQFKDNIFNVTSFVSMLIPDFMSTTKKLECSQTPHWNFPMIKGDGIMTEYERGILKRYSSSLIRKGSGVGK